MGPKGTGVVAVPTASPQPQEGCLSMALCKDCVTLAHFLGREKGTTLGEMNFSSKRGCAQLRQFLWL